MDENKEIKKDTSAAKPTCPKCNKKGFVRKHDTKGDIKRFRCMNPDCKHVFSVSQPKLKNTPAKSSKQLRKEFEIIYVWISDYQTISTTARSLKTTNYYVKKAIHTFFEIYFSETESEAKKSYSEVRKLLRNDRYQKTKECGSGTWLKTIWVLRFPQSMPFLFGQSENQFREEIEKNYNINVSIKKIPPTKVPIAESFEKDITQLMKEYKILLDWIAVGGHNLHLVANCNGAKYKEIVEIIRGRFKAELGASDNRIRELRKYIKKKRNELEIKDAHIYGYEYCCEQFKLALFDPKSDFHNGIFRSKEEITKEYGIEIKELNL